MQPSERKRKWEIHEPIGDRALWDEVSELFKVSSITARLIVSRAGTCIDDIKRFVYKTDGDDRSPELLTDVDKAVGRILDAVNSTNGKDEVIAVYGDYDVDGVTSVSLLYLYLTSLGAHIGYYIPSRSEEGYGMSRSAIDKLKEHGVTLIITVDTGITANAEVEYAASLDIDVIITDHHECHGELPRGIAVVNPHRPDSTYPFIELAGVGVVYKLVCACEKARARADGRDEHEAARRVLLDYGDLVALGTVADVMPLRDENRLIVSYGIAIMENNGRCGVKTLIEAASPQKNYSQPKKRTVNTGFIGFGLAPRLNAAGRMGNASIAVELLLSDNEEDAKRIAEELCEINRARQAEENAVTEMADRRIEEECDLGTDRVIVIDDDCWQQGIIGIVASRITEKYCRPSILVSFDGMLTPMTPSPADVGKGSGRSIKGFNLVAAMTSCEDLLLRYGGHELAAGLSVTRGNLPDFKKRINEYAAERLDGADLTLAFVADAEISISDINLTLAHEMALVIEPCGVGNPTPTFIIRDVEIISVRGVGGDRHTKLSFSRDGISLQAMYFGKTPAQVYFNVGEQVDIMFTLGVNVYNGVESPQLTVTDVTYSQSYLSQRLNDRTRLRDILAGGSFSKSDGYLPDRSDFVNLYTLFLEPLRLGRDSFSDQAAICMIHGHLPPSDQMNYVKYKLLLALFDELGIFEIKQEKFIADEAADEWNLPQEIAFIKRPVINHKIDIESSPLLARLRANCSDL